MTDWEQRMADKARSRGEDGRSLEAAERQAYIDEHAGHHEHFGSGFRCSCGEDLGVVTIAITDEMLQEGWLENTVCAICGERGVGVGRGKRSSNE